MTAVPRCPFPFVSNSPIALLASSPSSHLDLPSPATSLATNKTATTTDSPCLASEGDSSSPYISPSISPKHATPLLIEPPHCDPCTEIKSEFEALQVRKLTYTHKLEQISQLFVKVSEHRKEASNSSCYESLEGVSSRIKTMQTRLRCTMRELVESVKGSYTRVLPHDQPSSITGNGYFPGYFIQDSLDILHRLKSRGTYSPRLQSLEAILYRSRAITQMDQQNQKKHGDGMALKADLKGKILADNAAQTIQKLKPFHQLWIPIATGVDDAHFDTEAHAVVLVIEKKSDDKVLIRLVNIGYGRICCEDDPDYAHDLVAKDLPCNEELLPGLSLLLSFHGDISRLYKSFESQWKSERLGRRRTISRPLCVSHTLRRLYRDHLGDKEYEQLMAHWTGCEASHIHRAHTLTGELPERSLPLKHAIARFENRAHQFSLSGRSLTEKQYEQHMQSLAATYISRYRLSTRHRTLLLSEIPLALQPYIHKKPVDSTDHDTSEDMSWSIVIR